LKKVVSGAESQTYPPYPPLRKVEPNLSAERRAKPINKNRNEIETKVVEFGSTFSHKL